MLIGLKLINCYRKINTVLWWGGQSQNGGEKVFAVITGLHSGSVK